MNNRKFNRWVGSDALGLTAQPNEEIIPEQYVVNGVPFIKKLSFLNESNCSIIVNDGMPIFLSGGQGFSTDYADGPIYSLKIVEPDIKYQWVGIINA